MNKRTPGRWAELNKETESSALEYGMDYRSPKYRREVFHRFYEYHLKYKAHAGCVYYIMPHLAKEWSPEQKYWFAYLNGCTQNPCTTWVLFNQFPDLSQAGTKKWSDWINANYKRLEFDTDRRYHKKDIVQCGTKYLQAMGGKAQQGYFKKQGVDSDPHEGFRRLWKSVQNNFYTFGRLSTFSYLEYLRIMGLNIDCDQLFLDDLNGSKSHRNGLCKVLGRDELDWHKSNPAFEGYTRKMLGWLKEEGSTLLKEAKQRAKGKPWEHDVSYFTLETAFCTYKAWYRKNRRYPNVYNDMFYYRIKKNEKAWPEIDFALFWEARKAALPDHLRLEDTPWDPGLCPQKQNWFRLTGETIMMHKDWDCFKNGYNTYFRNRSSLEHKIK